MSVVQVFLGRPRDLLPSIFPSISCIRDVVCLIIIIIIIMAGMAVFNVAGYLIEERRRWPVNYRFPTRTMF